MYTFESRIRYSEIEKNGELSLVALLHYFQDSSTFHAEDAGVGLAYLQEKKLAWVLAAWQIETNRYPTMGEQVIVGTAPYAFKGVLGFRNFLMETREGERLACANTIWTLMDMSTMRPVRPEEEMRQAYQLAQMLPMEQTERKIKLPESGGQYFEPLAVRASHLDTNQHVNNVQYIGIAMEYLPEAFRVLRMRAEYKKQARLQDRIVPVLYTEKDRYTVVLQTEEGETCCAAEFWF